MDSASDCVGPLGFRKVIELDAKFLPSPRCQRGGPSAYLPTRNVCQIHGLTRSMALMSAPCSMRNSTHLRWPLWAQRIKGVSPICQGMFATFMVGFCHCHSCRVSLDWVIWESTKSSWPSKNHEPGTAHTLSHHLLQEHDES